jgi:hypothetical protein
MKETMDIGRRTWIAAIKLAVVISMLAAVAAIVISSIGDVPPIAIVGPVIIVAFIASWVQTGRVQRAHLTTVVIRSPR